MRERYHFRGNSKRRAKIQQQRKTKSVACRWLVFLSHPPAQSALSSAIRGKWIAYKEKEQYEKERIRADKGPNGFISVENQRERENRRKPKAKAMAKSSMYLAE